MVDSRVVYMGKSLAIDADDLEGFTSADVDELIVALEGRPRLAEKVRRAREWEPTVARGSGSDFRDAPADTSTSSGIAQQIYALVGREVNLSSPGALQQVIGEELGLPLVERSRIGYRVDSVTLKRLQETHPHEFVELLLRWRETRAEERRQIGAAGWAVKGLVSYADIAEIMGVKVQTVRVYAVRDEDFPSAVSMVGRTPLRSRKDLALYLQRRENRRGGSA